MGLDIGSSECKSAIFTLGGDLVSIQTCEYSMSQPQPGWCELNPKEVWIKLIETMKKSVHISNVKSEDIVGISISSQGEAIIPVGKNGEWLYPAIHAFDNRTIPQCEWWGRNLGRLEVFKITGQPLHPMYSINKIMWIRDNNPAVFRRTRKFLCFEDYILFKLTGKFATDYSIASRTMAFNVVKKHWSSEMLSAANLSEEILPDAFPSGKEVGEINSVSAKETGLKEGTIVSTGGHDQACGALGVGVVQSGPTMDATGTVECLAVASEKPHLDKRTLSSNYPCYCHVKDDMYIMLAWNTTAGSLLRWMRDQFCEKEKDEAKKAAKSAYDLMTERAKSSPSGSFGLYVLPYFMGSGTPTFNPNARGVIMGLTISHTKADVIRAVLEGITYDLRQNIELLESYQLKINALRAIGGGARSEFWLKLKADITGKKVELPNTTESAVLGAAILAGAGAKIFSNVEAATEKIYKEKKVYYPNEKNQSIYESRYQVYKEIYPTFSTIFKKFRNSNF